MRALLARGGCWCRAPWLGRWMVLVAPARITEYCLRKSGGEVHQLLFLDVVYTIDRFVGL